MRLIQDSDIKKNHSVEQLTACCVDEIFLRAFASSTLFPRLRN